MKKLRDELESLTLEQRIKMLIESVKDTDPKTEEQLFEIAYDAGFQEEEIDIVIRLCIILKRYPFLNVDVLMKRVTHG